VYCDPPATVLLIDHARQLSTSIQSWGNNNLVVWNPGAEKARAMADFDDAGYRRMLCIEPANALQQCVTLQPGECQRLGQRITVAAIATT
jgi:glucose-6-phosphate 1-epimerase